MSIDQLLLREPTCATQAHRQEAGPKRVLQWLPHIQIRRQRQRGNGLREADTRLHPLTPIGHGGSVSALSSAARLYHRYALLISAGRSREDRRLVTGEFGDCFPGAVVVGQSLADCGCGDERSDGGVVQRTL